MAKKYLQAASECVNDLLYLGRCVGEPGAELGEGHEAVLLRHHADVRVEQDLVVDLDHLEIIL